MPRTVPVRKRPRRVPGRSPSSKEGPTRRVKRSWEHEAAALPRVERLHLPFSVLVDEAIDVARVARRCWTHATDPHGKVLGPGLSSALGERDLVGELLELVEAVNGAEARYRLIDRGDPPPLARAEFVHRELRAALRWLGESTGDRTLAAQVKQLSRAHARARSHDAIAAALYDYTELANRHRAPLSAIASLEKSLVEEATSLARALREHAPLTEARPEQRDARDLRDRLAMLLTDRVRTLRAVARFAFRRHPALIRELTSGYERKRRKRAPRAMATE